jgi:hypothetical protein
VLAQQKNLSRNPRLIRDADDLVCRLTIKLEIELSPEPAVSPLSEVSQFAPTQQVLRECRALDPRSRDICLSTPSFFSIEIAEDTTPRSLTMAKRLRLHLLSGFCRNGSDRFFRGH